MSGFQRPDLALQGDVGTGDAHDVGIGPFALQGGNLAEEVRNAFSPAD